MLGPVRHSPETQSGMLTRLARTRVDLRSVLQETLRADVELGPPLPPHISPRYIRWMSQGPTYQVSVVQKQPDGRNDIRILLRTKDREAANYLVGSLEQDGQAVKLEVIPPGKGDL